VDDIDNIADTILEFTAGKEVYVSIDIDVVDPSFAPSTGYQVPGGLTSRQLIYILQRMNKIQNFKAVDIVEINSEKDETGLTVKLGAKILAELL
jgi:arginase family enzyme